MAKPERQGEAQTPAMRNEMAKPEQKAEKPEPKRDETQVK